MDKPNFIMSTVKTLKIEQDNCIICKNIDKEKNIIKITKCIAQKQINNVILEKELYENSTFINYLNSNEIKIFDGRWLEKYLVFEFLNYIIQQKSINEEETEIAVTANEITDLLIETIKALSKIYKKLTVVTNHINKLRKIEREIYENEGINIILSNNQKKSLIKPSIIVNMDFNNDVINRYKINENAIILNLEGNVKIQNKRFNGICINNYEIGIENMEKIFREDINKFNKKDLYEANIYARDTFKNIRNKIQKDGIYISEIYGTNGKIERFY